MSLTYIKNNWYFKSNTRPSGFPGTLGEGVRKRGKCGYLFEVSDIRSLWRYVNVVNVSKSTPLEELNKMDFTNLEVDMIEWIGDLKMKGAATLRVRKHVFDENDIDVLKEFLKAGDYLFIDCTVEAEVELMNYVLKNGLFARIVIGKGRLVDAEEDSLEKVMYEKRKKVWSSLRVAGLKRRRAMKEVYDYKTKYVKFEEKEKVSAKPEEKEKVSAKPEESNVDDWNDLDFDFDSLFPPS